MKVYHIASIEACRDILAHGFRDGVGKVLTDLEHGGVWVTETPLWIDSGFNKRRHSCLMIEIDEVRIAEYEWIEEGKDYREWLVPAAVLNDYAQYRLMTLDEA